MLWYFIKNTSNPYNNSYYYFKTKYLEPFTVPVTSQEEELKISQLARRTCEMRCEKSLQDLQVQKLQKEIDEYVYKIYKLSSSEIDTIEKAASW